MRLKVFIIHVSTNMLRQTHMEEMLKQANLPFEHEFINQWDVPDITEDILNKYFINTSYCQMHVVQPATSCALKHITAYQQMLDEGLDGALILEDDIFFHKNFLSIFLWSLEEYQKTYQDVSTLISYEDSSLLLVPQSKREKDVCSILAITTDMEELTS